MDNSFLKLVGFRSTNLHTRCLHHILQCENCIFAQKAAPKIDSFYPDCTPALALSKSNKQTKI